MLEKLTMNKLLLIAGAIIASACVTTSVIAAQATGTATAGVVVPMGITNTSNLEFGDILGGTSGTVIIDASGNPGGTLSSTGIQSAGTFSVTGANSRTFSITIAKVGDLESGAFDLIISGFTHNAGATPTLSNTGLFALGVGATITADGGEGDGEYTGTYTVDVDYN